MLRNLPLALALAACAVACRSQGTGATPDTTRRLAKYTSVKLATDTTALTPKERQMLPLLIDAARAMDAAYWMEAVGPRDSLLAGVKDSATRRLLSINYGPWDRLENDTPFVAGAGPKPPGANLYPRDIAKPEFDAAVAKGPKAHGDSLKSLYTLVRRTADRSLVAVPYHVAFKAEHDTAAAKLRAAAALADDAGLKKYLEARALALETDEYRASDIAWMQMKTNTIDVVIGPIETYEDGLYGYKAAHEALVLVKDKAWSERLAKFAAFLPALQRGLPVPDKYKQERPGNASDLNAYDAVYYAGHANAGAKTIAINLPNDEQVQLTQGTRRLQLKNVIRAKFDQILVPIANELVSPDQISSLKFDAFFENTMFHEVAHGLGIKNTLTGRGTVRAALKERYGAVEEGKADILGLYMVQRLIEDKDIRGENLMHNYVAFLASLIRSVRFGGGDAHGRANIVAFNFLMAQGAIVRVESTRAYRVDLAKMMAGTSALAAKLLTLEGDGDYDGLKKFQEQFGTISPVLRADLDRLNAKGIPVDVTFDQ